MRDAVGFVALLFAGACFAAGGVAATMEGRKQSAMIAAAAWTVLLLAAISYLVAKH